MSNICVSLVKETKTESAAWLPSQCEANLLKPGGEKRQKKYELRWLPPSRWSAWTMFCWMMPTDNVPTVYTIKSRRSRSHKPETEQVAVLATYILATRSQVAISSGELQLFSGFSSSWLCSSATGERQQPSLEFSVCYAATYIGKRVFRLPVLNATFCIRPRKSQASVKFGWFDRFQRDAMKRASRQGDGNPASIDLSTTSLPWQDSCSFDGRL